MDSVRKRLQDLGAQHVESRDPEAAPTGFFEDKWKGPDGTVFDITDEGWVGAQPLKD